MVFSTPNLRELMEVERWDAENYTPYLRAIDAEFSKSPRLAELATVTHASEIPRVYCDETKSKLFLLAQNIRPFLPDTTTAFYIPDQIAKTIPTNRLEYGDVLVTRSGANSGVASVYMGKNGECYTSGEGLILRSRGNIDGAYIVAFLNSQIGLALCRRAIYGSGQPHIGPKYLEKIPVPRLGKREEKIAGLVREANALLEKSKNYYPEAEAELLDRLGWNKLAGQATELHYVTDFDELEHAERMDAGRFHPQYKRLIKHFRAESKSIHEICHFVKHGIQPPYVENGTVGIVSQRQFTSSGLDLDLLENFTSKDFIRENPDFSLKQDDVLTYCVSAGIYLGQTWLYDSDIEGVPASFVTVLRTKILIPGYLALFLNSPAGTLQSNCLKRGTSPFYLYPRDLREVFVFVPKMRNGQVDLIWQEKLAAKVKAANHAKHEAKSKLAQAKQLVEQSIKSRNN